MKKAEQKGHARGLARPPVPGRLPAQLSTQSSLSFLLALRPPTSLMVKIRQLSARSLEFRLFSSSAGLP